MYKGILACPSSCQSPAGFTPEVRMNATISVVDLWVLHFCPASRPPPR